MYLNFTDSFTSYKSKMEYHESAGYFQNVCSLGWTFSRQEIFSAINLWDNMLWDFLPNGMDELTHINSPLESMPRFGTY